MSTTMQHFTLQVVQLKAGAAVGCESCQVYITAIDSLLLQVDQFNAEAGPQRSTAPPPPATATQLSSPGQYQPHFCVIAFSSLCNLHTGANY
jgi:hypothetical protein